VISFVYLSNRPGSIDLLSLSFHKQQGDYELVIVDGFPGRIERGVAIDFLRGLDIKLGWYGLPKKHPYPGSVTGFANAMNTGVLHSRGDYVVFVHDYMLLPGPFVRRWEEVIRRSDGRTLTHGIGFVYTAPKPEGPYDIWTWVLVPGSGLPMTIQREWIPSQFDAGYFGAPMSFFEEGNGVDEHADSCPQWTLNSLLAQVKANGYRTEIDTTMITHMIDHQEWHEGYVPPVGEIVTSGIQNSVWRSWGELRSLLVEPEWTGWGANPYNLKQERLKNIGVSY